MLAGGRSSRFGADKLATIYRGKPLLYHAIERLSKVCDPVVVVLAPGDDASMLPEELRIVHDRLEGAGPLAGLLAGMETVTSELALVVGGDMPELVPAVLTDMVKGLSLSDAGAVALHDGDRVRPLPVALRVDRAQEIGRELFAVGERSLRALLDVLDVRAIDADVWTAIDPDRGSLFDVDVPGDLPPA